MTVMIVDEDGHPKDDYNTGRNHIDGGGESGRGDDGNGNDSDGGDDGMVMMI
jgi:hypothetical protein